MANKKGQRRSTRRVVAKAAGGLIDGVTNVFTRVFTNPLFIVAILLGWWMSTNESKVRAFLEKIQLKPLFKPVAAYLLEKVKLLPGAVTISVSTYTLARPRYALFISILATVLILEVFNSETPFWEHAVLAFFICAITSTTNNRVRLVIASIAIITAIAELWGASLFK